MRRLAALLAVLPAAAAAGQVQFTSPPNVGPDGGSSVSFLQPFVQAGSGRRYQYVLGDVDGIPDANGVKIDGIALRPDSAAGSSAARTLDLNLVVDHADPTALSATFAANYSGNETAVLTASSVNLPATSGGSGFAITFPFEAPFLYLGAHHPTPARSALLVEFRTTNVSAAGAYTLDCVDGTLTPQAGTSSYLGLQGCTVPPNTAPFDIYKRGPTTANGQTTCGVYAQRGPATSVGVLSVGITDPNSTFGSTLCAPLRALPDLLALPASTDALGNIGSVVAPLDLVFPDLAAGMAVTFYTQFAVHEPGRTAPELPVALSDAVRWDVTAPRVVPRYVVYSNVAANAATGTQAVLFVPVLRCN